MAQFEYWMTTDLKRGSSQVQVLHGQTFTQDNLGNRVGVVVLDGGEPATLDGTVTGYVIRADGGTVLVTGAVDGNKAYIDLPESAYAVPGQIQIAIRLTSGSTKTVLGALNAYVQRTATGTIIDPGHVVPDIDDIIAKMDEVDEAIDNAEAATAAANTAAQNANNATGYIAVTEATSTASAAHAQGSYLIYDGKLYQATADIAIGDSLATTGEGANIAQVTGGAMGEVTSLKSAINLIEITNQTPGLTVEKQKYVNRTTGAIESNTSRSPNAVSGIQVEGDAFVFKIDSCEVAGVRGIAFYDGNGDFIPNSGKAYTIGETTYFFTIPAGAVTMAVTTFGVDNIFSIQFVYFQNTDKTLTESNVPADAAITGDEIQAVKSIAESNTSLIRSVLTTNTTTYNDTPDRGISGQNSGFILSDPNDVCTIKITPTFSSETNPYTPVLSGTFTVRLYRISRENDTITLVEQIGDDTSYSIGDEVTVNGFDGTMLFDIRNAVDSNNNIVKVGYIYSGKSWGNTLVSFTNTATTATTFAEFGIGGTCTIIKASIKGKISSVLDGKRITVIGDSITEKNYRAVTNWPLWIEDWTGAVVQNLGISGSGFIRTSPYKNRISQIDTPDIIGVAMTWNDLLSGVNKEIGTADDVITEDDTIAAWVNEFFDLLITAYPTTPIIAYCQSPWAAFNPNVEISNQYISVMTELLAKKGIPYYKDLYYGCVLRPWLDANKNVYYKVDTESSAHYGETDGIHPNSEGHKVIARYLYPRFAENIVSTGLDYVLNAL